jgi:hypothetical protein
LRKSHSASSDAPKRAEKKTHSRLDREDRLDERYPTRTRLADDVIDGRKQHVVEQAV